jgi:hypothetical protein
MLKINASEKYYRPSTHSDGSSARVARVISNSWFSRLYRIPVKVIDSSESARLKVAECAAQMDSGSTLHSEVMEWTTTSVRPGGRARLSEGLETPDWTVLGSRIKRSGILSS